MMYSFWQICRIIWVRSLQWRHNWYDSVSNHQLRDCLLNRLFRRRSKKTSKLCVTGLCVGNSPVTSELPAQMASNAENVSIWWRHHILDSDSASLLQGRRLIANTNFTTECGMLFPYAKMRWHKKLIKGAHVVSSLNRPPYSKWRFDTEAVVSNYHILGVSIFHLHYAGGPRRPPPPTSLTHQYLWPRPPGVRLGWPGCKPGHSRQS